MRRIDAAMSKSQPHPVPASGLFGSIWHLSPARAITPSAEQFEARYVANDRSAGEDTAESAHRLGLVA